MSRDLKECGDVAEWLKALAWKAGWRQRLEGSNPSVTATFFDKCRNDDFKFKETLDFNILKPL